jgi:1,4-alpha-glucan branching enzyme
VALLEFMQTLDQKLSHATYSARSMAKPVHFYCEAPKARAVHLVGDFNGWNPTADEMAQRVDGWWFIEVNLTHGHHRYRFLVDERTKLDPRATGIARDDNGEEASMLAVS